jgi:3-oxoacyl-[acyl-carrier protein] reductase
MDLGLKGKVALVAAASKGLGRACAEELASEGARVVICARGAAALESARAHIAGQARADVHAVPADLSTMDGIDTVVTEAQRRFGQVDILVNNAGGPPAGPFEQHAWDEWEKAIHLNLRSTIELTRRVLPAMRERRWGRIINVTSIAVKQPVDGLILSNSVRAAVTGWARTLANEVARDGITVNNVLPGYTRTDRVQQLNASRAATEGVPVEEIQRRTEAQIPMRRLGEPREFGALVAFLASERASYVTAQSIVVDGGWVRGLL